MDRDICLQRPLATFLGAALALSALLGTACGSTSSSESPTTSSDGGPGTGGSGGAGSGGAGGSSSSGTGGSAEADAGGPPLGAAIHAKQVAVGVYGACAVLDDDRVACWGENDWGQLGNGSMSGSRGAVVVPGLAGATRVVIGSTGLCLAKGSCFIGNTTCALLADGTAQCWGIGAHGELGNEREGREYFERRPVALKLTGIVDLAIGGGSGCAVVQDGTVSCWGSNTGLLGFTSPNCGPYYGFATDTVPPPAPAPCQTTPRAVPGLRDAARVAVSGTHQCVLHRDASVTCWGNNVWGELGNGTQGQAQLPTSVPGAPIAGLMADRVAVGSYHTCAVRSSGGSIDCWGDNESGQLGLHGGNDVAHAKPTPVPGLANAKALSLVGDTTMALLADGTAFAWGDINYVFREEPNPGNAAIDSPTKMTWLTDSIDVATSGFLNCAVHQDHTVTCWNTLQDDYQVRFQDP